MGTGITGNWARRKRLSPALLILLAFAASVAWTSTADAYIYWADGTKIGRANLDGTGAETIIPSGAVSVAVDGSHIYWGVLGSGSSADGSIGRANLDGSGANPNFISGVLWPNGVAVDGAHIYWSSQGLFGGSFVGRANLDGSGVEREFIHPVDLNGFSASTHGVAVNSNHIFWGADNEIGRATLDGSVINHQFASSPPGAGSVNSIAINSGSIYWTYSQGIARSNLGLGGVGAQVIPGNANNGGLAATDTNVYWGETSGTGQIKRAGLDGQAGGILLDTTSNSIFDLDVDSLGPGGNGVVIPVDPGGNEPDDPVVGNPNRPIDDLGKFVTFSNNNLQGQAEFTCKGNPFEGNQVCSVKGSLKCAAPCNGGHKKRLGRKAKKVGTISGSVPEGETGKLKVKLAKSMSRVLKKGAVKVKVTGTVSYGAGSSTPLTGQIKLKLQG